MDISLMLRNPTTMAIALALPSAAASSSTSGSSSLSSSSTNGQQEKRYVQKYLTNCKSFYSCIYCRTHLANHDELVSRSFQGNHGRAYLFNSVINISCGPAMQRELNTGAHAVADIYCSNCETTLGWKYEKAYVKTQKYKEGKYIIELAHVVRENRHLEMDKRDLFLQSQNIHHHHHNTERSPSHSISATKTTPTSSSSSSSVDSAIATSPSSSFSSSSRSASSSPSSSPSSSSYSSPNTKPVESTLSASIQSDNHASIRDILDDDLMFPYYDDLCLEDTGRVSGSFVGSFSSACLHNRIRRSLYLDSKPYDWKYSTRSVSEQTADTKKQEQQIHLHAKDLNNCNNQQRDNDNFPKLSWQHKKQQTASINRLPSSSSFRDTSFEVSLPSSSTSKSTNYSSQSITDKRQNDHGDDEVDSGNDSSTDEQMDLSKNMNQREQQPRDQVDESEIQFNFEADSIMINNNNYSQHQEQLDHQIATARSKHDVKEQFSQQNNNKLICDQQQTTKVDKFEPSVQTATCSLTSNGNSSNDNNNNNNDNDNNNNNNTIRQPVSMISNMEPNQKSNLENKPPKLGGLNQHLSQQSSTTKTTTMAITNSSSSFSFDDEEFYDCYTS